MQVIFTTELKKFGSQGEKTGWTYINVPKKIAEKLKPGEKRSYRVKGFIDDFAISGTAMIPMGEGEFIIAVNAAMRKGIRKQKGAVVEVRLEVDAKPYQMYQPLLSCLEDEPAAKARFNSMPLSHQRYYSKWIEAAKTEATRTRRIAAAVNALEKNISYAEMLRSAAKK